MIVCFQVGVKKAQCSNFMDIGSVLSHHETQLSKMLSTVAERLGSVKHISTV